MLLKDVLNTLAGLLLKDEALVSFESYDCLLEHFIKVLTLNSLSSLVDESVTILDKSDPVKPLFCDKSCVEASECFLNLASSHSVLL